MPQATINPFPRNVPVKVIRRRVLQHDLDMFAAICGRPAAGAVEGIAQNVPSEAAESNLVRTRSRGWSPSVLSAYLGQLAMPKLAIRVVKPEVADWVRKLSSQAMERLQEAQDRLASARQNHRNAPAKGEADASGHLEN